MDSIGGRVFYIEKRISKTPIQNMHHHRSFELYYMVQGEREYFIEDRFFVVREGDLVLIPPNVFHRTDGDGGLRYLVHFSEKFLQKYYSELALHPLLEQLPFVFRADDALQEIFQLELRRMLTEFENGDGPHDDRLLSGMLYHILFIAFYGENCYIPEYRSDERITEIVHFINSNFHIIDDIESIAKEFYISKYHLCRYFKKCLGISLITYLNTIKIRHACEMIRDGNNNLTDIALQCGFNSSSYFCKVFKSEKGISPTQYRKKYT